MDSKLISSHCICRVCLIKVNIYIYQSLCKNFRGVMTGPQKSLQTQLFGHSLARMPEGNQTGTSSSALKAEGIRGCSRQHNLQDGDWGKNQLSVSCRCEFPIMLPVEFLLLIYVQDKSLLLPHTHRETQKERERGRYTHSLAPCAALCLLSSR